MKTGDGVKTFIQSEIVVHHEKDHTKITQFTKFEVLSLDYNHVEGFQKSDKLETLWIWGTPSQNETYVWHLGDL